MYVNPANTMKFAWLLVWLIITATINGNGQPVTPSPKTLSAPEISMRYRIKKESLQVGVPPAFVLPVPEQDCLAAIPLCDSTYTQTNAYVGQGVIPNEIDPGASCLLSGEKNDVWYTFTVQAGGNLNFSITPINGNDDYDWALFNLTNHVCADIFTIPSLEVSCNYAPNLGCGGVTGPNNDTTGNCGGQNEAEVPVLAGETYVINVSNFSSTQFGYTINFGASSAVIYDNVPPQPTVCGMNCTDSVFIVSYPTELIACNTIAADGSDFYILDLAGNNYPVLAAAGIGCGPAQPFVNQIRITLQATQVPFPGFFLLTQTGSDGNSFSDKCGNFAGDNGFTDTVAFVNVLNNIVVNIGPDTTLCAAGIKPLLDAQNTGAGFVWSYNGTPLGATGQTLQTTLTGTYMVTVTYGTGCTASDSMTLNLLPGFPFSLGSDTSVCSGNPYPVLYTGITNAPQYSWYLNGVLIPGAHADSLLPLQAGTYVAIVDSGLASCPGTDTVIILQAFPAVFSLGADKTICEGDSVLLKAGLAGGVSYLWAIDNQLLPQNTDSFYANQGGHYSLLVTTTSTCISSDTVSVFVEQMAGPVTVGCPVNTGLANLFTWDAVPGAVAYEVSPDGFSSWGPPSSGSTGTSHSTSLQTQKLFVRALSGTTCPPGPASESLPCDIVISNILTPNSDGLNDFFFIRNLDQYPGSFVKIRNRWGVKIYESTDYKNDWDGNQAPDGVYFYEVGIPGKEHFSGTVTLIHGE